MGETPIWGDPQMGVPPKSKKTKKSQKNNKKYRSKGLALYLSAFRQENSKTEIFEIFEKFFRNLDFF